MIYRRNEPFVSVIIVTRNRRSYLENCLRTVLATDYSNFEVILVDNASTDGSVSMIRKEFRHDNRLRILVNKENLGCGHGRNIGLGIAGGDYYAFLDDDTEVSKNWIEEAIEVLESNYAIGAVQAKILFLHERTHIHCVGGLLIPSAGSCIEIGGEERDDGSYDQMIRIIPMGACMFVKAQVVDEVGGLDPEFSNRDDMDFGYRIWMRGYNIVFAPKSVVYHRWGPASIDRMLSLESETLRLVLKNYSSRSIFRYLPSIIITRFFLALLNLGKGSPWRMMSLFKALGWNLKHLRDTLTERYKIQKLIRKISDERVFDMVGCKLSPYYFFKKKNRCLTFSEDDKILKKFFNKNSYVEVPKYKES